MKPASASARISLIALMICLLPATGAIADSVTFVIDPTQSSLTASGSYQGRALQGQPFFTIFGTPGADSLVDSYGGTITANLDAGANTLELTGGNIAALENAAAAGSPGLPPNAVGNYAFNESHVDSLPGTRLSSVKQCPFLPLREISPSPSTPRRSRMSPALKP